MNEKITLQDIVNLLSEKQGINRKEAELFVRTVFDLIEEALTNEKYVKIKGLGTFKLTEVNSRESVNVNTGERFEIQGHSKVSFTPDTTMKELINKPFSHFETVVLNDGVELEDTVVEDTEVSETPEASVVAETPTIEQPAVNEEPVVEKTVVEESIVETPQPEVPVEEETTEVTPATLIETEVKEEEPIQTEEVPEEAIQEEPKTTEEVQPEASETEKPKEEEKPILVEEKKEAPSPVIPQSEEKKSSRILVGIIIVLVLIILLGFYWLFMRQDTSAEVIQTPPVQEEVTAPQPVEEEKVKEDTLEIVQYIELSPEELRNERVASFADTLDYQIIGTKEEYTLQKGETIIRASVKFFGTKKYWPYIVKHNMDVLPDPDNIPAGVRIKIPKLAPKN